MPTFSRIDLNVASLRESASAPQKLSFKFLWFISISCFKPATEYLFGYVFLNADVFFRFPIPVG